MLLVQSQLITPRLSSGIHSKTDQTSPCCCIFISVRLMKNLKISSVMPVGILHFFYVCTLCAYGLSCWMKNVTFMYMSFLSYLLPKLPYCYICTCVWVCSHAHANTRFCGIHLLFHAKTFKNDLFYWVPYYNSCAKYNSSTESLRSLAIKSTVPMSITYLPEIQKQQQKTQKIYYQIFIASLREYH